MARILRTLAVGVVVAVGALAPGGVAPAHADAVDTIGKRLVALQSEIGNLRQGIKRPSKSDHQARNRAERRLIDGQVAFGVGNYDDAALMLYDYVEQYPNSPSFDEALYYLGESLFQKGDFVASRTYFTKLVRSVGATSKFYQQGLERLIELSLELRDSKDVADWLTALDAVPAGKRRSSVPYVRGKYAYFKEDYQQALGYFQQVPPNSGYHVQARYFMGACYIATKQLGKAAQEYDRLVKRQTTSDDEKRIIELSHMALGRLYYERDQPSKAIDQYLEVERKSDLFDEALYEVAWVYVKNTQFDKALRALELLALADPSSSKMPEVKILEGNLRIRKAQGLLGKRTGNSVEEYDKATVTFEATREAFTKPHAELARLIEERADPSAFMAQITGRTSRTFDVNASLPEVAAAWLRDEPDVKRVVDIESDLGEIADEIAEAERTIERLEQALASPSRVDIFPGLAEKRTRATEIIEEVFSIRQQLATHERALVSRYANAGEKSQLSRRQQTRQNIARELSSLPNAEVAYGERIARAKSAFVELDKRAAEVATVIDGTRATLVALEKYLADQAGSATPLTGRDKIDKTIASLRDEVAAMSADLAEIRREAVLARDEAGTGDAVALRARDLRARLRVALSEEHKAMAGIIGRMQGGDRTKGNQIASLMRTANTITLGVDEVQTAVDEIVEYELAEVRSSLNGEKARLAAYKREFVTYEAESRELGSAILTASFKEVKDKFYDVLVRSDIGIIDVAWSQKEGVDEADRRLNLDRLREVRTLQDEFRDVLAEDGGGGK